MMDKKIGEIELSKEYSKLYRDCKFKKCIFPDQSKCSEKVIRAHSIQKNKILNHIAENGMVVSSNMLRTLFTKEFDKIGIGSASTFFGFCNFHDSIVFSEIENKDYVGTIEQNFLHSYRACAIEYVKKNEACCFFEKLIKKNKDSPFEQYFKNKLLGFQWGVKDISYVLGVLSNELVKPKYERRHNIVSTTVKKLSYEVLFAVNASFTIEFDFEGKLINDLTDTSRVPAHIFLNIFPQNSKTYILFSCLTENLNIYKGIISKLNSFHDSKLETFFSNMIISCLLYTSPSPRDRS